MQSIAKNGAKASLIVPPVRPEDVTVAKLEQCLDRLAEIMDWPDVVAERLLPLWERLEREIELRRDKDDKLAAARERARRLKDQRARPSC